MFYYNSENVGCKVGNGCGSFTGHGVNGNML